MADYLKTRIFYYIGATANSGKVQVRPITAPDGWWKFRGEAPNTLPQIPNHKSQISIFPNPSGAITYVPVNSGISGYATLKTADLFGREVVKIFEGYIVEGERNFFWDAKHLDAGIYLLIFEMDHGEKTVRKLLVK